MGQLSGTSAIHYSTCRQHVPRICYCLCYSRDTAVSAAPPLTCCRRQLASISSTQIIIWWVQATTAHSYGQSCIPSRKARRNSNMSSPTTCSSCTRSLGSCMNPGTCVNSKNTRVLICKTRRVASQADSVPSHRCMKTRC